MDLSILLRLGPALAAAVAVGWLAVRGRGVPPGQVLDQALRALLVGFVAARLTWVVLGGPLVWRRVTSTLVLVRAGVETWAGVLVALAWMAWRTGPEERRWVAVAAPSAALTGVGVWQGLCGVEGVCAGIPASWGAALPGYASRVVPVGYLEAAAALALAAVAFRFRERLAVSVGAAAAYAFVRVGLGFLRAPLASQPTRDQVLAALAAVVLAVVARRTRAGRVRGTG